MRAAGGENWRGKYGDGAAKWLVVWEQYGLSWRAASAREENRIARESSADFWSRRVGACGCVCGCTGRGRGLCLREERKGRAGTGTCRGGRSGAREYFARAEI